MAVKYKITKEEHAKLSDDMKGEYSLVGNDYVLDLDGGPDMKAGEKFTAERDKRRAAEKRANDAEAKITELEDQYSDGRTAVAKAEKKAKEAEDKATAVEKKHLDYVKVKEVDTVASDLANKLSKTAPKLLLPHVRAKLDLDMTDPNAPKVVVLGDDGKPSTTTLEQLEKNFRDNKEFAAIVTASHASGGGASRQQGGANGNGNPGIGGGNQGGTSGQGRVSLGDLSGKDLAARISQQRASQGLEVPAQSQGT